MAHEVLFTEDAERDLEDIYAYILKSDCRENEEHVLERLVAATGTLAASPERGTVPKELRSLGIQEYRQVFFRPYRVIYRVHAAATVGYLVADGGRDLHTLLSRRLLETL